MIRVWSPSSGSTLITSAPWSASSMVQNGPASICVRSTIRTPSSAPRTVMRRPPSVGFAHISPRRRREARSHAFPRLWGKVARSAGRGSLVSPVTAPLDQHPALALEDVLVALVHAVVLEPHDARVLAVRIPRLHDLAEAVQRVAVIKRAFQPDLVHAQFGQRILGGVLGRQSDAHRDGDAAEAQPLAVVAVLGPVLVEVRLGGVHGHVGDPD